MKNGLKIAIPVIVIVIILIVIALFSHGFGLGKGSGDGNGKTTSTKTTTTTDVQDEEVDKQEEGTGTIPDIIIVRIDEDKVFINDNPVANKEELSRYIEEYDSDIRKFKLVDNDSILATYDWVTQTFEKMGVGLDKE